MLNWAEYIHKRFTYNRWTTWKLLPHESCFIYGNVG